MFRAASAELLLESRMRTAHHFQLFLCLVGHRVHVVIFLVAAVRSGARVGATLKRQIDDFIELHQQVTAVQNRIR